MGIMGPIHDWPERHTAFMAGQDDYLAHKSMDPSRWCFKDDYRIGMYNAGWAQESLDHAEAVPIHKGGLA